MHTIWNPDSSPASPAPAERGLDAWWGSALPPASLVDLLRWRAATIGHEAAYTFLDNGETPGASLSWAALDRRSRALAVRLRRRVPAGSRALLVYPPGLDFVTGFFGCLYAGLIAVPVAPPRGKRDTATAARLAAILSDASPAAVLSTFELAVHAEDFRPLGRHRAAPTWLATDEDDEVESTEWAQPRGIDSDTLALLQYTSGSTAEPRGVMVTHGNLLQNLADGWYLGGPDACGPSVSWLPVTHDMGLIEGLLQPLFAGTPVHLMAPAAFLQRPVRWLQAISRLGAVRSGGPNFAYDLCASRIGPDERRGLDLSSWRAAYSGAEPIRTDTLRVFARTFQGAGFDQRAFRPCYGLAEATLVVTSGRWTDRGDRVSCGQTPPGTTVRLVDPETRRAVRSGEDGEIWVSGPGVAKGYWNRQEDTRHTFEAAIAGESGRYLRTGDLGRLTGGELVVTGRLKDLLIVRGHKHFPQDLERTAELCHPLIRPGSAAACPATPDDAGDRIVLVAEVETRPDHSPEDLSNIIDAIRLAIVERHGLQLAGVALVPPRSVPRTTSGKLRRFACLPCLGSGAVRATATWGGVPAGDVGREGDAA